MIDVCNIVKEVARAMHNCMSVIKLNANRNIQIGHHTKVRFAEVAQYVKVGSFCNIQRMRVSAYTYIGDYCELPQTQIGKFSSIAGHVVLASGNHPMDYLSTSPYTYAQMRWSLANENYFTDEFYYTSPGGDCLCEIGNDVWIGTGALLVCGKSALSIGDGAVIAAGAVVTRNVPPYAVVAGCPAKVIRYRFDKQTIIRLQTTKWWERDAKWLVRHTQYFDHPTQLLAIIESEDGLNAAVSHN